MPDTPDNRTFRLKVKLVNADDESIELPVGGFVMIPEDRLRLFETISTSARDLVKARQNPDTNVQMSGQGPALRLDLRKTFPISKRYGTFRRIGTPPGPRIAAARRSASPPPAPRPQAACA